MNFRDFSTSVKMHKLGFLILIASLCIVYVPSAHASILADGYTAYHAHDYATAAADFQQAAAQSSGIQAAKADFMLGLSLHHEGKNSDAVTAYQNAQSADPTISFAKSSADFQHNLQIAQRDSGSTTYVASGAGATAPTKDQAAYALTNTDVYVAPDFPGKIDQPHLADAAADDYAPVKIAILNQLPNGYSNPTEYAKALNDYLHIGRASSVIVVAINGPGAGVADYSDQLSQTQEKQLAEKYVARIGSGEYNTAIFDMAHDVSHTALVDYYKPMTTLSYIFIAVCVIVFIVMMVNSRRKKAVIVSLRGPANAHVQSILEGISHIDEYVDVLPKNNADTDQIRAFRQAAAYKVEQAQKIIARATDTSDMNRAESILQQANSDVRNADQYLNRATGGAATQSEPLKPVPFPTTQSQAQQVPDEQRGVSFFSSQPAPVSQLTPVTMTIDGQQKTVMATPQEAAQVQRGQIPPVRSFNVGGQSVPWYAYQNYDPYDDYWTYQNNGWRGVAGGAIAGFIGAELLDSLFAPRPYWGGGWYSPYAYGPGWDSWGGWNDYDFGGGMGGGFNNGYDQGYFQGEENARAQDYALNDQYTNPPQDSNYGGASFLGNSPGYDTTGYNDNSSGASFMGGDNS